MARLVVEHVSTQCGAGLARIFTASVIKELVSKGYSAMASRILRESQLLSTLDPKMSLREFFEGLFALLFRSYRNEYIYKSVIANRVLLGRHSLNTSFMLTEFRAGDCKADVVILNGTCTQNEISQSQEPEIR